MGFKFISKYILVRGIEIEKKNMDILDKSLTINDLSDIKAYLKHTTVSTKFQINIGEQYKHSFLERTYISTLTSKERTLDINLNERHDNLYLFLNKKNG